jgi:hypothetical protein
MADSLCGRGTGTRNAVGVCRPKYTRATQVPWHHTPYEPTGVGDGPLATQSQFCAILAELACLLACHTVSDRTKILQKRPLQQGLASHYTVFSPHGSVRTEPNAMA